MIAETVLVRLNLGRPELSDDDPFVGFSSIRPLFVLSEDGTRYETAPSRRLHFAMESFAAQKSPDEYRIFVLGGSTVQGNPYSIATSFTTWLELSLQSANETRRWEVVNCGGISYASYRLVPIMQELLAYAPDLFIVYTGQNEFLEDRTYGEIKNTPWWIGRPHVLVSQLRTYNVLRAGLLGWTGREVTTSNSPRSTIGPEVEALLDFRGGMESYHRDEHWRQAIVAHFRFNLRRMVAIASRAGVPLILMNPVCNLRDSPPFKSEHRADLADRELARWESLWAEARQLYDGHLRDAIPLLEQAVAIDGMHAGIHYDLAKCYEATGRVHDSADEYLRAKELDVCPLRILEVMNDAVLETASQTKTPLVDARALFERISPGGIPGHEWLVDHVHPSIRGHQVLADALADQLVRLRIIEPAVAWKEVRDRRYAEHLNSLDAVYYIHGQQHLESLTRWAEGRILKERQRSTTSSDSKIVATENY